MKLTTFIRAMTDRGVPENTAKSVVNDVVDVDFEGPGNVGVGLKRGRTEGDYARWNSGTTPASDMPSPVGGDRDARGLDGARQVAESSTLGTETEPYQAYQEDGGLGVVKAEIQEGFKMLAGEIRGLSEALGAASRSVVPPNFRKSNPNATGPDAGVELAKATDVATLAAAVNKLDDELSFSERVAAKKLVNQFALAKASGDFAGFENSLRATPNSRVRDVFGAVYRLPEWKLS